MPLLRRSTPRHGHARPFVIVGVTVAIGLAAALTIVVLSDLRDERRRFSSALADFATVVAQESALEWQAAAKGGADKEILARHEKYRELGNAALARAYQLQPDEPRLHRIEALGNDYWIATDGMLALLADDNLRGASVVDESRVEPLHDELTTQIEAARSNALRTADTVGKITTGGTIGVMLLAALLIGVLFVRYERARRAAVQAYFDPLTGLANRALFADRLGHAHTLARRSGEQLAVVFIDLDDFKLVNDSLGHATGDALIVAAGTRIAGCARASDTVARLGGDEFAVLLEGDVSEAGVRAFADRVGQGLEAPIALGSTTASVSATIGYALGDGSHDDPAELMRNADLAMYAGKRQGKNIVTGYEPAMFHALIERLGLEADLRNAVEQERLTVAYQPVVDVAAGRLVCVEALARWEHPERGAVAPAEFISLAEETGLIEAIGRWVLRAACRDASGWAPDVGLSVNVSPAQFGRGELPQLVASALAESGMPARRLIVEITESLLGERGDLFLRELEQLDTLGVRIAVDDFGIGYSSLGTLGRFPLDILKIDRTLVANADDRTGGIELLRSIVDLSSALGLETIAEGVERRAQREALATLGCTLQQGFLLGEPMSAAAVGALLRSGAADTWQVGIARRDGRGWHGGSPKPAAA